MTDQTISAGDRLQFETHVLGAAVMARALWRTLDNDALFQDPRDAAAVRALALEALEHAEHAQGLFERLHGDAGDV